MPLFNPDALWFEVCESRPADIEGWCTVCGFYVAEDARPVGPPHNEFIPMHTILVRRPGWGVR